MNTKPEEKPLIEQTEQKSLKRGSPLRRNPSNLRDSDHASKKI